MKLIVLAGFLFATYFQVTARSIGIQSDQMPTVLRETSEQSFSCVREMGPRATNLPKRQGIQLLPEDNPALNELMGCVYKKKEIINDAADVNTSKLEDYWVNLFSMYGTPDSNALQQIHEVVEACKDQPSKDYGLKSIQIQNCMNRYILEKRSG